MGYFYVGNIKCPNCEYTGKAKAKGPSGVLYIIALALFIISFFFLPLFFIAILFILWVMFKPRPDICPKCNWEHPVPVK